MSEFPFMAEVPVSKSYLQARQEQIDAWKEQWGVWTYYTDGMSEEEEPWLAICIPAAHRELEECGLTDEEKTDPILLFVGYCRLIEESGISATAATEQEACARIARNLQFVLP